MNEVHLKITGMSCAACIKTIELALKRNSNVVEARVNIATSKALIYLKSNVDEQLIQSLISSVKNAGYLAEKISQKTVSSNHDLVSFYKLILLQTLSLFFLVPMILEFFRIKAMLPIWLQFILATICQFTYGIRFYKKAFQSLKNKNASMDVLISLGTTASYLLSIYLFFILKDHHQTYFESGVIVISFVYLGKYLEELAKRKARKTIFSIEDLLPQKVRKVLKSTDTESIEISLDDIKSNDLLLVLPGERIPADGIVIRGSSHLNEAQITGESLPVSIETNSKVHGGSQNLEGAFVFRVTKVGADTKIAQLFHLLDNIQGSKLVIEKTIDKVSQIFVPAILILAILTFISWFFISHSPEKAFLHSIAVIVIACPCALGLAVPITLLVGSNLLAKNGILLQNISILEKTTNLNEVVFDKTGTLTEGAPFLVHFFGISTTDLDSLKIAASLEAHSEHPLARPLLQTAKDFKISLFENKNFKAIPGIGVTAEINNNNYAFGNKKCLKLFNLNLESLSVQQSQIHQELLNQGATISYLCSISEKNILGIFAFSDPIKESASKMIDHLKKMKLTLFLLSGDQLKSVQNVAQKLKIDSFEAEASPEEKLAFIEKRKKAGSIVLMVGDGINDSAALSKADLSISVSQSSELAQNSADILLLRENLLLIPESIHLLKSIHKKIKQNLFWAFSYNAFFIPLAAFGFLSPSLAGIAMAFSSVSVVLNALTLYQKKVIYAHS